MTWVRYEPGSRVSQFCFPNLVNTYGGDSFDRRDTTYSTYKTDERQRLVRCRREYGPQAKPCTNAANGISLGSVLPILRICGPLRRPYRK